MMFIRWHIVGARQCLLSQVLYIRIDIFVGSCKIMVFCLLVSQSGILRFFRMHCMLWFKVSKVLEINGAFSVKAVPFFVCFSFF